MIEALDTYVDLLLSAHHDDLGTLDAIHGLVCEKLRTGRVCAKSIKDGFRRYGLSGLGDDIDVLCSVS